jgi:bifunctional non-homologous end joining protein LigD
VGWDELDRVTPAEFTVHSVIPLIGEGDPWAEQMPTSQRLDPDLVAEGREIPIARVQAMHEGKRRARRSSKPST